MLPQNEEYFPRGGSKPAPTKLTKPKQDNLFGVTLPDKSKAKARKSKNDKELKAQNDTLRTEQAHSLVAEVLSYNKIQDGMLILGIVRKIKSLSMEVELPGRTYGELQVKSISSQYYKELNKRLQSDTNDSADLTKLNDIFTVGQFIPTRVLSINDDDDKGMKIMLSTEPNIINANMQHSNFLKNMLIWGAIAEKSDHAYLIDVGVLNCRVVLPFDKVYAEKTYGIGDPLYCVVTKSVNLKEASTLTVSALKDDIDSNTENTELNLDHAIPGMQVKYTIERLLKDGLEGKLFNECMGYINEIYLSKTFDDIQNYSPGQTINARVLYTQHTTKFTYLSIQNLDIVKTPSLKIGDIISSKVISRAGSGVILKLNKSEKGFVTHKRILNTIKANANNITEIVKNKYALGTDHKCRILDYCRMDRMYICTFEPNVIKEKFFTKADLKVGETVKGIVKKIVSSGVVLSIGKVEGIVSNIHLSSSEYSENIKKSFHVGQQCNAKLLFIDPRSGNLRLTMKPELLSSNLMLKSYEDVEINTEYIGVVVLLGKNGALVTFYGDVKGWLKQSEIPQMEYGNFRNMFYEGQVIKCKVKHRENTRLTLTMQPPVLPKKMTLMPGRILFGAKIANINLLGMDVEIGKNNSKLSAFLPTEQLCHRSIAHELLKTYSVGDELPNLMCLSSENTPIVSLRECIEFKRKNLKVPLLQEVKQNVVLRCSYDKHIDSGISISTPIRNFEENLCVRNSRLLDKGNPELIKFHPYQTIIAKVIEASKKHRTFKLTSKLSEVFSYDYKYSVSLLESYLLDFNKLQERLVAKGNQLAELKIGQSVQCVINKIDKTRGCSVFILSSNVQGLVDNTHCPKNMKSGSTIGGVVLSLNFEHNYAEISLKPDLIAKINPIQDGKIDGDLMNSTCYADILSVNTEYALGSLRNKGANKQLVYLPVRLHENDFKPQYKYYNNLINQKVKIILSTNINGLLIGFEKNMIKNLKKLALESKPSLIVLTNSNNNDFEVNIGSKRKLNETRKSDDTKIFSNTPKTAEIITEKLFEDEIKDEIKSEVDSDEDNQDTVENLMEQGTTSEQDVHQDTEMETSSDEDDDENVAVDDEDATVDDKDTTVDDEDAAVCEEMDIKEEESETENEINPILPGIQSFFKPQEAKEEKEESSSDDDDDGEPKMKKKKKLTPAERAQQVRLEEDRLRKIETDLADSTSLPQSAEQFDRILLGNPDNSEMWTRYIAFHAQSTEFEKARLVAKRALEKISYTAIQDRLNVWLAYLNLENMYGTKESFEKAFEEASRCNDTLTIYLETIKMLSEMQKYTEMDEKIKKVRGKYKQDLHMWLEVGKVYYSCKRFVDARKLKDIAIVTLADKKTHISLIVQFAILEFNQGEQNQGEALFETILQSDPKRVDVWSTYVDQLIKKNDVDLARNVLGRAVGQKLPYKKMRTLFKKYHSFEKTYGNEETIEHVKTLLKEYGDK